MKHTIDLRLIELEDDNYHLVAPAVFNHKEEYYWIVDTGASKTVFDLNLKHLYDSEGDSFDQIHTAGVGDKPIKTAIGTLTDFKFNRFSVSHLYAALLDLSHINNFYARAASLQICGLLGSDFLLRNKALINYKKKTLTLSSNTFL